LYFENSECLNCHYPVGFDPAMLTMLTLEENKGYRYCKNAEYGVCNWLVPASSGDTYCVACTMNRVIPSLTSDQNRGRWRNLEVAKHRLIYSLLRLRLPLRVNRAGQLEAIVFDFKEDVSAVERVMTGHDHGIITINIEEADEAERVRHKLDLGERYRTLLGHFRHEVGHYYWDALVSDNNKVIGRFRKLFGDERQDYGAALEAYYARGVRADWNQHFISPYATSHPWEDWAETWAHYLHMMDTLETAWAFGIRIDPKEVGGDVGLKAAVTQEPYDRPNFDRLIKRWLPLCFAVNSLNRSMGHADFYPFILSAEVIEKLRFIHELCLASGSA
jgi:hypothetical protein